MNRTPLYDLHVRLGAKLVDFAGWEMPLRYTSIIEEHHATRRGCTLFDVSHMGRIYVSGSGATDLLEQVCTRRIGSMASGQSRYTHICNADGGVLDDLIVSCVDPERWLVVCNASNRGKIFRWLEDHARDSTATLEDHTTATAMVAIQGPQTAGLADDMLPFDVTDIKRYSFRTGKYMGIDYVCSRTGYTGEDGFEIIVSSAAGRMLANGLFENSTAGRITPAGLGARDTLRLEAAMPLYGHELHEQVDSISAGQGWCVDLDKPFIGRDALRAVRDRGPQRTLIGFTVDGQRIARQHATLQRDGAVIGEVTSGSFSPTLQKVIGLAFIDPAHAQPGTPISIDARGRMLSGQVTTTPFYRKPQR